jgi:hypothetical protein
MSFTILCVSIYLYILSLYTGGGLYGVTRRAGLIALRCIAPLLIAFTFLNYLHLLCTIVGAQWNEVQ